MKISYYNGNLQKQIEKFDMESAYSILRNLGETNVIMVRNKYNKVSDEILNSYEDMVKLKSRNGGIRHKCHYLDKKTADETRNKMLEKLESFILLEN